MIKFLKGKLLSRKLWLTIISVVYFLAHDMTNEATAIILGYLGIQGIQDIKNGKD